jgi:hypothetical protein
MATDGGGGVVDGRARQKWPLTEGAGWWMAERDDFKRGYWSRVEIPTRMQIFFLLIFVYKLSSMNSYML